MFDERRTQEFIHLFLGEKCVTRNYVSRAYAREIQVARVFPNRAIDWEAANRAIIQRWSKSALEYIKTRAWKLLRKCEDAGVTTWGVPASIDGSR
jgi:hypothetical protein